ncbi:MAG: hypothetical protein HQL17_00170 [Candidatus Omnitrophica bacterium]|nr:hypothetical protein [Candidatus Omnitrophota bacterium]
MLRFDWKSIAGGLFVLMFSIGVTFYCQQDALKDRYCVQDDVMQYLPAFAQYEGARPPENDLMARYSWTWNTIGSRYLYATASRVMDPLLLSKVLPFILCPLTALLCYLCAVYFCSRWVGVLAAVLVVLHAWSIYAFSGGHPRAFAFPLLAGFLYFMLRRKLWLALILIVIAGVFYPQIALIGAAALAACYADRISEHYRTDGLVRKWAPFMAVLITVAVGGCIIVHMPVDPFLGKIVSWGQMRGMPEFSGDGRTPFFISDWVRLMRSAAWAERIWGMNWQTHAGVVLTGCGILGLYLAGRRVIRFDPVLYWILTSALVWGVLACFLMMHLFFPGRFLKFALPLVLSFSAAAAIVWVTDFGGQQRRNVLRALVVAGICLWALPTLRPDLTCYDKQDVYAGLRKLPADAMIAGHPAVMNEISVFTGRKVFLSQELSLPFYQSYYAQVSFRTREFFRMYYAVDVGDFKAICRRNNIRYVLVKEQHFTPAYLNEGRFYLAPYNEFVHTLVLAHEAHDFVLSSVNPAALMMGGGAGYFIVDVLKM